MGLNGIDLIKLLYFLGQTSCILWQLHVKLQDAGAIVSGCGVDNLLQ